MERTRLEVNGRVTLFPVATCVMRIRLVVLPCLLFLATFGARGRSSRVAMANVMACPWRPVPLALLSSPSRRRVCLGLYSDATIIGASWIRLWFQQTLKLEITCYPGAGTVRSRPRFGRTVQISGLQIVQFQLSQILLSELVAKYGDADMASFGN